MSSLKSCRGVDQQGIHQSISFLGVSHLIAVTRRPYLSLFPVRYLPSWFPGTHYATVARSQAHVARRL